MLGISYKEFVSSREEGEKDYALDLDVRYKFGYGKILNCMIIVTNIVIFGDIRLLYLEVLTCIVVNIFPSSLFLYSDYYVTKKHSTPCLNQGPMMQGEMRCDYKVWWEQAV